MTGTAAEFERHRPRLTALACRLTGRLAGAEAAVQEAWLRLAAGGAGAAAGRRRRPGPGTAHRAAAPAGGVLRRRGREGADGPPAGPGFGADRPGRGGLTAKYGSRLWAGAQPVLVNGEVGLPAPGEPDGPGLRVAPRVIGFAWRDGLVSEICDVVNPEKLRRVRFHG